VDAQEVLFREESTSLGAHVVRIQIVSHVEESGDQKLFIVDALDRADSFHAEVAVQS